MSAATFAPDHEVVGRYRIVELLGVGRTAEVYRAEDRSLHRTVVVKVLLADLASHEDVRRAFRDNIVRAATLSHPHVARVYDGGQESGSIFVVSEYLSGGSLEDVLASGRRFSADDAARLGRDIASGLSYLHANGIVHGALAPTKLVFDEEGRVRITDISLAGLADQYRGRPTLDQVRYFSPEQALGEPAGPASDVYSLALILFEAATGTAAFDGLTTEMMAQARIGAPLPVRAELGTLDMLLAQAAIPDPLLRLDAEQLAARLNAVVKEAAPLNVAPGNRGTPLLASFTPAEPRTSIGFHPPSPNQIVGGTGPVARVSARPLISESAPVARSHSRPAPRAGRPRHAQDFDEVPLPDEPRRRRVAFLVAAVVLVVAAVAGVAIWKSGALNQPQTVPSLVSLDYQQAAQVVKGDGFTLRVAAHVYSSSVPARAIVTQSPRPGAREKAGQVISVTVSDGPRMVAVPAGLLGEDCATASAQLQSAHLTGQCPSSDAVASATVPVGRVVRFHVGARVNPTRVPVRSIVTLVLSSGAPATTTPSTTPPVVTTTVPPVATTTTVPATTTTTVAGEGPRPVPNVVGMDQAQVFAAMRQAQLYFSTRGPNAGTKKWTIAVSTQPAPGTSVPWHSTIIVNVR